jgi:hypothetical protein
LTFAGVENASELGMRRANGFTTINGTTELSSSRITNYISGTTGEELTR